MKTRAAILIETGQPLEIVSLDIPPLKPGQALIKIAVSGVCHTQLLECRGFRGPDKFLPHGLGHEGSGMVEEVGADVSKVMVGDRVIVSWMKGTGHDVPGTVYRWNERNVNAGAVTTFSEYAVISENRLTVLPVGFAFRSAALMGCAIPTGMGALLNTAQAKKGQSVVVFGVGGVGLCALAAAVASGCSSVIAVDLFSQKLEIARQLGAGHVLTASAGRDVVSDILKICPNGVDVAVEATGQPSVMRQALQCVRPRGGKAVIVGNARFGSKLELDPQQFNLGKQLLGTWGGDNRPDVDFPTYIDMVASGRVNLAALESHVYTLDKINQALDDLEAGAAVRPLIQMIPS